MFIANTLSNIQTELSKHPLYREFPVSNSSLTFIHITFSFACSVVQMNALGIAILDYS